MFWKCCVPWPPRMKNSCLNYWDNCWRISLYAKKKILFLTLWILRKSLQFLSIKEPICSIGEMLNRNSCIRKTKVPSPHFNNAVSLTHVEHHMYHLENPFNLCDKNSRQVIQVHCLRLTHMHLILFLLDILVCTSITENLTRANSCFS